MRDRAIGDQRQEMVDTVEACTFLVVALDDIPRCLGDIGAGEHLFFRLGILLPPHAGLQVHRRQLPLLHRVVDAHEEAKLLFLIGDGKPVFDDADARADQHTFEFGDVVKELLDLRLRGEAHHALDACAVIPRAVEQHALAARGQVGDVALEIPLGFFAIRRRGQRHGAHHAGVEALRDAFDYAALARAVTPLEDHHDLFVVMLHPILQLDKFGLQADQRVKVAVAVDGVGMLGFVDPRDFKREGGVFKLQLDVFMEGVGEFGLKPIAAGVVVRIGHGALRQQGSAALRAGRCDGSVTDRRGNVRCCTRSTCRGLSR
ncbi:hypothetical protein GALL_513850 [mine drainage metagenome]|uniref:Uncharacterized protein n=1 Tax=mine drainage metagenome TaxID=410659 RepID=A0A1J5P757_9ZZZZ